MKKSGASFRFLSIDAICHTEFSESFGIQSHELPTSIIYSPSKNRYQILRGSYSEVTHFLSILHLISVFFCCVFYLCLFVLFHFISILVFYLISYCFLCNYLSIYTEFDHRVSPICSHWKDYNNSDVYETKGSCGMFRIVLRKCRRFFHRDF